MTLLLLLLIVFGLQPCAAALPVLFVRRFVTGSTGEALSAQAATEISQRLEQTYSWHSTGALVADLASNTVDDIVAAWTDCTQGFVLNRQALVNWLNQNQGSSSVAAHSATTTTAEASQTPASLPPQTTRREATTALSQTNRRESAPQAQPSSANSDLEPFAEFCFGSDSTAVHGRRQSAPAFRSTQLARSDSNVAAGSPSQADSNVDDDVPASVFRPRPVPTPTPTPTPRSATMPPTVTPTAASQIQQLHHIRSGSVCNINVPEIRPRDFGWSLMQVNGHKYPDHYRRSYACLGTFECRECGNIDRPRTQRGVQERLCSSCGAATDRLTCTFRIHVDEYADGHFDVRTAGMHTAHATPPEIGGFHHRTLETQNQALSRLSALGPSVTTGGPANRPQSLIIQTRMASLDPMLSEPFPMQQMVSMFTQQTYPHGVAMSIATIRDLQERHGQWHFLGSSPTDPFEFVAFQSVTMQEILAAKIREFRENLDASGESYEDFVGENGSNTDTTQLLSDKTFRFFADHYLFSIMIFDEVVQRGVPVYQFVLPRGEGAQGTVGYALAWYNFLLLNNGLVYAEAPGSLDSVIRIAIGVFTMDFEGAEKNGLHAALAMYASGLTGDVVLQQEIRNGAWRNQIDVLVRRGRDILASNLGVIQGCQFHLRRAIHAASSALQSASAVSLLNGLTRTISHVNATDDEVNNAIIQLQSSALLEPVRNVLTWWLFPANLPLWCPALQQRAVMSRTTATVESLHRSINGFGIDNPFVVGMELLIEFNNYHDIRRRESQPGGALGSRGATRTRPDQLGHRTGRRLPRLPDDDRAPPLRASTREMATGSLAALSTAEAQLHSALHAEISRHSAPQGRRLYLASLRQVLLAGNRNIREFAPLDKLSADLIDPVDFTQAEGTHTTSANFRKTVRALPALFQPLPSRHQRLAFRLRVSKRLLSALLDDLDERIIGHVALRDLVVAMGSEIDDFNAGWVMTCPTLASADAATSSATTTTGGPLLSTQQPAPAPVQPRAPTPVRQPVPSSVQRDSSGGRLTQSTTTTTVQPPTSVSSSVPSTPGSAARQSSSALSLSSSSSSSSSSSGIEIIGSSGGRPIADEAQRMVLNDWDPSRLVNRLYPRRPDSVPRLNRRYLATSTFGSWTCVPRQPQCSVCLQDFCAGEQLASFSCGHSSFHRGCAEQAPSCPVCRELRPIQPLWDPTACETGSALLVPLITLGMFGALGDAVAHGAPGLLEIVQANPTMSMLLGVPTLQPLLALCSVVLAESAELQSLVMESLMVHNWPNTLYIEATVQNAVTNAMEAYAAQHEWALQVPPELQEFYPNGFVGDAPVGALLQHLYNTLGNVHVVSTTEEIQTSIATLQQVTLATVAAAVAAASTASTAPTVATTSTMTATAATTTTTTNSTAPTAATESDAVAALLQLNVNASVADAAVEVEMPIASAPIVPAHISDTSLAALFSERARRFQAEMEAAAAAAAATETADCTERSAATPTNGDSQQPQSGDVPSQPSSGGDTVVSPTAAAADDDGVEQQSGDSFYGADDVEHDPSFNPRIRPREDDDALAPRNVRARRRDPHNVNVGGVIYSFPQSDDNNNATQSRQQ